jgi:hypothetical protein
VDGRAGAMDGRLTQADAAKPAQREQAEDSVSGLL